MLTIFFECWLKSESESTSRINTNARYQIQTTHLSGALPLAMLKDPVKFDTPADSTICTNST